MNPVYIYDKIPDDLEENGDALLDWRDLPEITRIINQMYSFYGNYAMNGSNRKLIKKGAWVKALWTDGTWQYFKIKSVYKTLQSVSFTATHLAHEANRNFIQLSYTARGNGKQIMANLKSKLSFSQPFEYLSDIDTVHQFTAKEVNPIDAIIGQNGGNQNLAGVTGGELDMDNYKLTLKKRIGEDNGFRIDLGVNLESIKETIDDTGVVNSLYLVGGTPDDKVYDDGQPPITYKYLEVKGVTDDNRQIAKRENGECKTEADLKKWGQTLFDNDRIHEPKVTHEINMVSLENTIEYKELYGEIAKLNFGDTVHCDIEYMGVTNIEERMIECVFYPTIGKYKSTVLGNDLGMYTDQVQTQVSQAKKELQQTASNLTASMIQATELINGVQGGSVYQHPKNKPHTLYFLDTDDLETAKHVIAINNAGIGFSTTGWQGEFRNAWTIDGKLNADFIQAGTLKGRKIVGCYIISDTDFSRMEISGSNMVFTDIEKDVMYGGIGPTYYKKLLGTSIGTREGYELSLVMNPTETEGGSYVLRIPQESRNKEPLLQSKAKWTHKGDLIIEGKLIVNGKEITGSGSGSGGGGGGGVPPELTTDQEKNAWAIWQFFKEKGWSIESIAGMLGNMQSESGIMPDIDEISGGGGYGLVQWTPKSKLVDWCAERGLDHRTLDAQCQRIQWEMENNVQWFPNYERPDLANISFREFTQLKDVKLAADYFIAFYEHPKDVNQPIRGTQAQYWYDKLKDLKPPTAGWLSPVRASYAITQEWDDPDYWSGGAAGIHGGIDLASIPPGSTPDIYAANTGTIMTVGSNPNLEGNYIMIDHGNSYYTYYGHLSSVNVKQGDKVTNTTVIGVMGNTGASEGVHLHFEVRRGGPTATSRINPRDVITF